MLEMLSNPDKLKIILTTLFYIVVCIPILYQSLKGLQKGFKITAWRMLIFLIIMIGYFLTLNIAAEFIFKMNLFGIPTMLEEAITGGSSTTTLTLKDLSAVLKDFYLNKEGTALSDGAYVQALFDGIFIYSLKIAYTLIYFIVLAPFFRLLMKLFIYNVFFKGKKELNKVHKDSLNGFLTGIVFGVVKSFIVMIYFGGLISLFSYSGQISEAASEVNNQEVKEVNTEDAKKISNVNKDFEIILLGNEEEEKNNSTGKIITQVVEIVKLVNSTWNENLFVKTAKMITVGKETEIFYDDDIGSQKQNILDKCFDEVIYFKYEVESSDITSVSSNTLNIKINLVSELNNVIQAALYIIDDPAVFQTKVDGSVNIKIANISSKRVEEAFNHLSELNLLRVGASVGLNILIDKYGSSITSINLNDRSIQNQILSIDISDDLSSIGEVVGGFIDLGLAKYISDLINTKDEEKEDEDKLAILNILNSEKLDSETEQEYKDRVKKTRTKIVDNIKELDIITTGGELLVSYLFDGLLKDKFDELGLNDLDGNVQTKEELKSYKENLMNSIDFGSDIGLIFELIFDVADFEQEGKLSYVVDKYSKDSDKDALVEKATLDEIAEFMNLILKDFSKLSFLQAGLDILVKISTSKINNEKLAKYLKEENVFYEYIDWKEEIGEKIPNLIDALVKFSVIDLFTTEDITQSLFNRGNEDSLVNVFNNAIEALFNLKIISNLEDSCLKPLLEDLLSNMSGDSFTIKVSDELGNEGHKFKDEILLFLDIMDDLIEGVSDEGVTSFKDLGDDTGVIIKGISNIDPMKLENSAIFAPTLINLLTTLDNEAIVMPLKADDQKWYTTYNADNTVKEYGEIYNIISALSSVSSNDSILNLFSGNSSSGGDDVFGLVNTIETDVFENMFNSIILRATLTNTLKDIDAITIPTKYIKSSETTYTDVVENINVYKYVNGELTESNSISIKKDEFVNLINAFKIILSGGTSLSNLGIESFKSLSSLSDATLDELTSSPIILATISAKVAEAFGSSSQSIIIPSNILLSYRDSSLTDADEDYQMISNTEVKYLIKAIGYFDFDSFGSTTGTDQFDAFTTLTEKSYVEDSLNPGTYLSKLEVILQSEIIHATISDIIFNMDTSSLSLVIPSTVLDSLTVFKLGSDKRITNERVILVDKNEISSMLTAITYLDINSFSGGTNVFSSITGLLEYVSLNSNEKKIDKIFESDILRATLSNLLFDLKDISMPIMIPFDTTVLDSESGTITEYQNSDTSQSQSTIYLIQKGAFEDFIRAASLIDLDGLSSGGDIKNTIKALSTNISTITNSKILLLSLSNYLFTSSSSLGFSGISFNASTITESKYVSLESSGIFTVENCHSLTATELNNLITGISYIDLNNLASDPLNVIKELKSVLNEVEKSETLKLSLASEIDKAAKNGSSWNFIIPENSYDTTKYVYDNSKEFNERLNTTTVEPIKWDDIEALINGLGSIDLNNIDDKVFLKLSESEFTNMLNSLILRANISDKFKAALNAKGDIIDETKNIYIYDGTKLYKESPDSTNTHKIMYIKELKALFNSMKLLGSNDLSAFTISISTLNNFNDDNDISGKTASELLAIYALDDNEEGDNADKRAKFLRSIIIRYMVSEIVPGCPDWKTLGTELKVSDVTKKLDLYYTSSYVIKSLSENHDIDFSNGNITFDVSHLYSATNTLQSIDIAYSLIINGVEYNVVPTITSETGSIDITSYIESYGIYLISVKAEITDLSTYGLLVYPETLPTKARCYTMKEFILDKVSSYVVKVSERTNVDKVSNVLYDESNEEITFTSVNNASIYEIRINDSLNQLVKLVIVNNDKAGTSINVNLKNQLNAGKYSYTITAINNTLDSNNNALYNSSVYDSKTANNYIEITKNIKAPIIEIISENNGTYLYVSKTQNADDYEIKIDENTYTTLSSEVEYVAFGDGSYRINLSSLNLSKGTHSIVVKGINTSNADYYLSQTSNLTLNQIETISLENITISEDMKTLEIKNTNAYKYQITAFRIENSNKYLQISKDIIIDNASEKSIFDLTTLFNGYKYEIHIKGVDKDNEYISNEIIYNLTLTKALSAVTNIKIDSESKVTFKAASNADHYEIKLYIVNNDGESQTTTYTNETRIYDSTKSIVEMFNDYEFDETKVYKISIVSVSNNDIYTNTESSLKKFEYIK